MIATAPTAIAPLHGARLHARPPGGAEPQAADVAQGALKERERQAARDAAREAAEAARTAAREAAELARLAARDRAVRAHEAAHAQVGGRYAGAPRFDYITGPDGQRYAIGGQVVIDLSASPGDPRGTIEKMRTVRAAALAPADPSPEDRRIASEAERMIRAAEADLAAQRRAGQQSDRATEIGDNGEGPKVVETRAEARLAKLAMLFARLAVLPAPAPQFSVTA